MWFFASPVSPECISHYSCNRWPATGTADSNLTDNDIGFHKLIGIRLGEPEEAEACNVVLPFCTCWSRIVWQINWRNHSWRKEKRLHFRRSSYRNCRCYSIRNCMRNSWNLSMDFSKNLPDFWNSKDFLGFSPVLLLKAFSQFLEISPKNCSGNS